MRIGANSVSLQPRKPTISWAASKEGSPPLLFPHEAPHGVLSKGLGSPAQQRHRPVGASPEDSSEDG